MPTHTTGPWKAVSNQNAGPLWVIRSSVSPHVQVAEINATTPSQDRYEADARLIAAAPELLAAAAELKAAFMAGCGNATRGPKRSRLVAAGAALDAAIAKATTGA